MRVKTSQNNTKTNRNAQENNVKTAVKSQARRSKDKITKNSVRMSVKTCLKYMFHVEQWCDE